MDTRVRQAVDLVLEAPDLRNDGGIEISSDSQSLTETDFNIEVVETGVIGDDDIVGTSIQRARSEANTIDDDATVLTNLIGSTRQEVLVVGAVVVGANPVSTVRSVDVDTKVVARGLASTSITMDDVGDVDVEVVELVGSLGFSDAESVVVKVGFIHVGADKRVRTDEDGAGFVVGLRRGDGRAASQQSEERMVEVGTDSQITLFVRQDGHVVDTSTEGGFTALVERPAGFLAVQQAVRVIGGETSQ